MWGDGCASKHEDTYAWFLFSTSSSTKCTDESAVENTAPALTGKKPGLALGALRLPIAQQREPTAQ